MEIYLLVLFCVIVISFITGSILFIYNNIVLKNHVKNYDYNQVLNKTITDVKIYYENIIEYPTSKEFKEKIINQKINDIKIAFPFHLRFLRHSWSPS